MCRDRNRVVPFIFLACIILGKDAIAAEWVLNGTLEQQLHYDDNIVLNTRKEPAVGYILTPGLQASRKTKVLDIAFTGQGDIRRYDDSRWDCNNYTLGSNNDYRTKRSVFSLKGGYSVNCSYSQQIEDTGIILPNIESMNYQITPSWTWQWTPRNQLTLNGSYAKTSFSSLQGSVDSNADNVFSGNETYAINLGGKHQWSRRLSLNGELNYANVQFTGFNPSTQDQFGFQLGADYAISALWAISISGGPLWVDTQQSSDSMTSRQNGSLSLGNNAAIRLNYSGQQTRFSIGFSNTVTPSAIGQTLQTSSIDANYSYRLTQNILLDITSSYSQSESIDDQSSDNSTSQFNRDYFTVAPGIVWKLAKNWQLRGSYVYRWQDFQQDNIFRQVNAGTSESNAIMLSLDYSWDGIRISR